MRRIKLFVWAFALICCCFTGYGQPLSGAETVRRYSIAQQRLLAISTARFLDCITVYNLDEDSLRSMACRITGLPWLLPYTEGLDTATGAVPMLLRQGITYLHWPTHPPAYLDSASRYIQEAMELTKDDKYSRWRNECLLLLGDYYCESGQVRHGKAVFFQLVSSGQQAGNKTIIARAWQRLGMIKENGDSLNGVYLNNSLSLYEQLPSREKEMELLWYVGNRLSRSDIPHAEKDFERILMLEQTTGFKHTLYAQYMLAFTATMKTKYVDASSYNLAALENLEWSGISALKPTFFTRMGATCWVVGKNEEALTWFEKAIDLRTKETHFYWYKSLLYLGGLLQGMGRPGEALSWIQAVTSEFPPWTPWEKMQINDSKGESYESLNKPDSADKYYRAVLELSNQYPTLNDQFARNYFAIAAFYVSRGNQKIARQFLDKGKSSGEQNHYDLYALTEEASLAYKIDSVKGDYPAALQDYIRYKNLSDSNTSVDQRNKFQELNIKYGADKKDQDIRYLKQQQLLQQIESRQNKLVRNILIAVAGLFLVIIGLLFSRYRLKQRTNGQLRTQQQAINDQNLALRNLVTEKDWLVKEIHHRVKNNFQTVMGLLGTQCGYLNNESAIRAIRDSQQRIQAMSLIHQRLYSTENLSGVSMSDYVLELVDFLRDSCAIGRFVCFKLQIEPIVLDLEYCIPLGLILNEAITNSFKYAFLDPNEGTISISLCHTAPNHLQLTINDNGVGLPPGFNGAQTGSMGMNLMHGLCLEIGASFSITTRHGTQITIGFDYEPESVTAATTLHALN